MRKPNHAKWDGKCINDEKLRKEDGSCGNKVTFLAGNNARNRVRNGKVRKIPGMVRFVEKVREWRLCRYGHGGREETYAEQRMLPMKPSGKRKGGRWFMNGIREVMHEVGV